MKKEQIEKVFNKHIRAYFDAIQGVLEKKETSNDINLDIEMKIFAKSHQALLLVKKELFALHESKDDNCVEGEQNE
jgi:hypothetical protein